jgi:hypothetical protein
MPSFTLTSDALIEPIQSFTLTSDALIVAPVSFTLTSDARMTCGPAGIPYCEPYSQELIEGVDYEIDLPNQRIRFLSTGRLANTDGLCNIAVSVCAPQGDCTEDSDMACAGACYVRDGYDTVFQEGAENYRNDEEKMMKRATVEAEPLPASSPAPLECDVAFGNQPSCMKWVPVRPLEFECQTEKSAAQHAADRTRPDDNFHFPTWVRGKYLSVRWRVTGIGGGGMFSALHKLVKGWGQFDAP